MAVRTFLSVVSSCTRMVQTAKLARARRALLSSRRRKLERERRKKTGGRGGKRERSLYSVPYEG